MASVVMADDGIAFDGVMAQTAPLGGAETAFVALAEALADLEAWWLASLHSLLKKPPIASSR